MTKGISVRPGVSLTFSRRQINFPCYNIHHLPPYSFILLDVLVRINVKITQITQPESKACGLAPLQHCNYYNTEGPLVEGHYYCQMLPSPLKSTITTTTTTLHFVNNVAPCIFIRVNVGVWETRIANSE